MAGIGLEIMCANYLAQGLDRGRFSVITVMMVKLPNGHGEIVHGKESPAGLWKEHSTKCPGVTPISYAPRPRYSLGQEAWFLPPAVGINQIHRIIAPFHPSLRTCTLPSNPRLLPLGMNPKADSVIFT